MRDESKFCGTLAHELCHYQSGHEDNSRAFENDLTDVLGDMIDISLKKNSDPQEPKHDEKKGIVGWFKRQQSKKKYPC